MRRVQLSPSSRCFRAWGGWSWALVGSSLKLALVYDLLLLSNLHFNDDGCWGFVRPTCYATHSIQFEIYWFSEDLWTWIDSRKNLNHYDIILWHISCVTSPHCCSSISSGTYYLCAKLDPMSSLSSSIADGEALLARSWSDLLEDRPGESETILKFGEKMLGTFGLWALTQPYFDLDAKNHEAEPGRGIFQWWLHYWANKKIWAQSAKTHVKLMRAAMQKLLSKLWTVC